LAAPKKKADGKTKEISRKHKIVVSKANLVSIIGGKWTTYREMGEDVVNKLAAIAELPKVKSITEKLHIHGYKLEVDYDNYLYFYGADIKGIEGLISMNPELGDWISKDLKINKAQVVWAVKNEYARNIEDVLARRTRALFLDAKESIRIAPTVANIMANELGYNNEWEIIQVQKFNELAQGYILN